MRNLILFATLFLLASCGGTSTDCTFSKVHITATDISTGKVLQDRELNDCFTASAPDATGLVEIKGNATAENLKVTYFQEATPGLLNMLNVKVAGNLTEWRSKKGHDLFVNGAPGTDTLAFVFGDRENTKIKGTITYTK